MAQMLQGFQALGLEHIPSFGNFVCVKVAERGCSAGDVFQSLLRQGVIVRPVGNYGMADYLRVSIGLPAQNARFLSVLGDILNAMPESA